MCVCLVCVALITTTVLRGKFQYAYVIISTGGYMLYLMFDSYSHTVGISILNTWILRGSSLVSQDTETVILPRSIHQQAYST